MKIEPKYRAPIKTKIPVQVWKDIPGYDGYQISSLGRVKSFKRDKVNGRLLKHSNNGDGYSIVKLCNNEGCINKVIHKLMQLSFKLSIYGVVDHINGIRSDNRLSNLRVGTIRDNNSNRTSHRNGRLVGTTYDKDRDTWRSLIYTDGSQIYLGTFETEQLAHERYNLALSRINNGETDKNKI